MKLCHLYESSSGRVLLVVLAILFTFCVRSAHPASEPGTITIVIAGEPVTLEPGDSTRSNEGQIMMKNVLETITEINPSDSSIIPRLAHSWKQIDANTWQLFLRKGVKFHDGEDFNAEAVIFNIKRLYDKRLKTQSKDKFFSLFTLEGKALDSHTLELKTDKPQPLLPTLLGILTMCSPNTPVGQAVRNPIGTGPYKFVRWDAGSQIILERFDGYWGKQPQVKKALYIWRSEPSVRAAMVLIGEADLAPSIAKQDANRPDMDASYLDSNSVSLRFGGEWWPPLNDRRFRMALNYAVDRGAIRGSVLSKDVVPATQFIVPNISGHNPDLKVWPYDPKKARQLLDEARKDGIPVDKEILLMGKIAHFPGADELPEVLMTMYKAVGLNVKIKMLEAGVFRNYERIPSPSAQPYILQKQHDNFMGDAGFTVPFQYGCKGLASTICDKQLDDMIEKAQVATGEERRNLWRAALKRIHEEIIPDVPLFHLVTYCRIGKRINFKPSLVTQYEIQLAEITFK